MKNNLTDSEYTSTYAGWGSVDSYTYAENAGITLRIDSVRKAVQDLAGSITTTMTQNNASYQMAVYGFNDHISQIHALSPATNTYTTIIKNDVANLTPPLMNSNNYLPSGATYTYPSNATAYSTVTLTSVLDNRDTMTNFDLVLNSINTIIPNPGTGTSQSGDTPQKVLVLVTDGVDDATLYNSSYCNVSSSLSVSNSYGSFTRCIQPVDTSFCQAIKNRGIRIAVLYVEYYPLPNDTFYTSHVAPILSQIATNLQTCASGPNLFFQINTDGDFSAALLQTFLSAVATAPHLTQ